MNGQHSPNARQENLMRLYEMQEMLKMHPVERRRAVMEKLKSQVPDDVGINQRKLEQATSNAMRDLNRFGLDRVEELIKELGGEV